MSDAPAPTPTPAAPASTAQPSTPTPTAGKGAPAVAKPSPRAQDGRFLPKESSAGVEAPDDASPETPTEEVKEPYRFKKKLKVYGQEEEVDLDEEGLSRELQIARANAKRLAALEKELKSARELPELAKANREEALKRLGIDPDDFAKERISKLIEMEQMSDEARLAMQAQQRAEAAEAKLKQREEAEAQAKRTTELKRLKEHRMATYDAAITATGWERTPETIYLLAETESVLRDDLKARGMSAFDFSPEDLAKAAQKRMDGYVSNYFKGLDTRGIMKRLGAERIQAILEETVKDFDSAAAAPSRPSAVEPPVETREQNGFVTPQEVDRRLNALIRGK